MKDINHIHILEMGHIQLPVNQQMETLNSSTVKSVPHFQEPGGKIDTRILQCQLPFQTNMTHNFSLFWGTSSTIAGGMKHNMVVLLGVYLKKKSKGGL